MATMIDGETYNLRCTITCSKGSGDSKEEFSFTVLEGPEGGKESWLLTENSKWWLFRAPPDLSQPFTIASTHEEFHAQKVTRNGLEQGERRFAWVALAQPYNDAPLPFQGTSEALVMGQAAERDIMLSVPLMQTQPDVFYTPSFPASKMERETVTPQGGLGGGAIARHIGLILAVGFAGAALLGVTAPVTLLWWLGPLAILLRLGSTRQSGWDHLLRLVAGAFFLHFVTHIVDNVATRDWDEAMVPLFESAKLAVIFFLLWVLRNSSPRAYFALVDGGSVGGGCSWLLFVSGIAMISMENEANYFQWFSWYSGELPWGILWLLAAIGGVWYKLRDYRKVPLDLRGFRSLLYQTADTLDQKVDVCRHKAASLEQWADDLDDALAISGDPLVASLADYGPTFMAWRDQAKNLAAADALTPDDQEHLNADLATIASDFRDLISCLDRWPESQSEFKSLRCSPMLGTWGQ